MVGDVVGERKGIGIMKGIGMKGFVMIGFFELFVEDLDWRVWMFFWIDW